MIQLYIIYTINKYIYLDHSPKQSATSEIQKIKHGLLKFFFLQKFSSFFIRGNSFIIDSKELKITHMAGFFLRFFFFMFLNARHTFSYNKKT